MHHTAVSVLQLWPLLKPDTRELSIVLHSRVLNPVSASSNVVQAVSRRRLRFDVRFKSQGSPQRVCSVQRKAEKIFSNTFGFSLAVNIPPTFHMQVLSRLFCFVRMVLDTHYREPRELIYSNPTSFEGNSWLLYISAPTLANRLQISRSFRGQCRQMPV